VNAGDFPVFLPGEAEAVEAPAVEEAPAEGEVSE